MFVLGVLIGTLVYGRRVRQLEPLLGASGSEKVLFIYEDLSSQEQN